VVAFISERCLLEGMFDVTYRGKTFQKIILMVPGPLTMEARDNLAYRVIDMYIDGKGAMDMDSGELSDDDFEGRITTDQKHFTVGAFSGLVYVADLRLPGGEKTQFSTMVTQSGGTNN